MQILKRETFNMLRQISNYEIDLEEVSKDRFIANFNYSAVLAFKNKEKSFRISMTKEVFNTWGQLLLGITGFPYKHAKDIEEICDDYIVLDIDIEGLL